MLIKKFFRFVIPSVLSMWIFALYTMVDGLFVAHGVGNYALAAVNLSMPYTIFIFSVGLLLATGTSTMIAIFLGEGKKEQAHNTFNQNLAVLIVVGIVISIVTQMNLEGIAYFLGASPETIDYVTGYLGWISLFAVFFILSYNMEILVKIDGCPKIQMVGVLSCALVNVGLDYVFVIKFHWGVEGAAIATGIAQVISTSLFLFYFKFKAKILTLQKFRLDLSIYKRIIPLGLSDSIAELSGGLLIFMFNHVILSVIGSKGVVTYTVISYMNSLALNSMTGINQGIQPLISYNYGAGKQNFYHKYLKYAMITAFVFGACFLALAELAPQLPVQLFLGNDDVELFSYSVTAVRLYGITFALIGFNVVAAGFFTAIERPAYALTISLFRSVILLSACLFIMAALFGEYGVWLSTCVSEGLCLFITGYFFWRYSVGITAAKYPAGTYL